jgi:hypothetical protein
MSVPEIRLQYERIGERYSAVIFLDEQRWWSCANIDFEEMITDLSRIMLRDGPDCRLVFRRTDGGRLVDYVVPDEERNQIRDYPHVYAAEKHDVTVVVRERPVSQERVKIHIRAGYDTLADAFGDNVYVHHRDDGCVECPCCGRWHARIEDETLVCRCNGSITSAKLCGSWVELPTFDLVFGVPGVARFYLPRAWNNSGPWISREALSAKYVKFIKETSNGDQ